MKTVSLIWGYSQKNAGDLAMTLGALDLLSNKDLKIIVFSLFHEKTDEFLMSKKYLLERYSNSNLEIIGSPFFIIKSLKNPFLILKQYATIICILLNINRVTSFKSKLLESDVIFFNGGNMFRCISLRDAFRLFCVFFPIKFILEKGIPCFILPQSSSSINYIGKQYLLSFLHNINHIFFREKISYEYFKTNFGLKNINYCMDLAFFINKKNIRPSASLDRHIALTIRTHTVGDTALFSQDKLNYIQNLFIKIVENFSPDNKITIVVQVPKDTNFSRKIFESCKKSDIHFLEETDPVELIKFYSKIDLLIGMRLHSMILAMSIGTPCYGLTFKEWGNKIPGIFEMMEMPYLELDSLPYLDYKICNHLINSKFIIQSKLLNSIKKHHSDLSNEITSCICNT